jgi:hypothetical protein
MSVAAAAAGTVVAPGHTYRARVRAYDLAGNVSDWRTSNALVVASASEAYGGIRYSTGWGTYSASSYWGGKVKSSSRPGATATFTFTGRSVSWVGVVGPSRGYAKVFINGVFVKTVNLYASTTATRRIVFTKSWTTSATRKITIQVVGSGTHPRVDIDGFIVTR